MAFECQEGTEIALKDTLNSPQTENVKVSPDQPFLGSNPRLKSPETVNIKVGLHFTKPEPYHTRSFTDLPTALVSEILNSLDPKELGIVSCVNTFLYRLASDHHAWKEFYNERWGHPVNSSIVGPECVSEKSWKDIFVEREFRSKTFMGRYSIDTLYGHTEAVRTVFVLVSKKLVFTSGYDQVIRMWDLEEGLSIASSRPLGCTIRAVAADSKLLIAGGTDGFIHGWNAEDRNPLLFDLGAPQTQNTEFRLWEHVGPITCLALDFTKIYSGSWDMTVRVWDRASLKCLRVLMHNDWVWSLVPHDTTLGSTAGSSVYLWETNSGAQLAVMNSIHVGNVHSLARSHTGKLLFTGGEDGSIHMFEVTRNLKCNVRKIATWVPHGGPVYSLAFEYPWLVSASSDGKIALIDVRSLLKTTRRHFSSSVEPPQRMLHGFGCNLFSIGIGFDRIVCGGEEGVVRIWNFSQALDIEERVRALRVKRVESRMRRQKGKSETSGKEERCLVAAMKNQMNGDKNDWHSKRRASGKVKA
ncbi:hypothetical protein CASFOL_035190 [Castilleja foliolosa]|uniref:F-box domain-containing protein n=1 Tax=Castilleja foliolosa TaxID=1961234 RepID=A0ABD3BRW7_9LAMI